MSVSLTESEKRRMDRHFAAFVRKLNRVGRMSPREEYLYPILKSVPFSDTETALEMAITAGEESLQNDNRAGVNILPHTHEML